MATGITIIERDILLHNWQQLESAAIVKDVATKGKHINLAIAFLAKRRGCSVVQSRVEFHTEIDAYVRQLLANGQVFRAEHVLRNLGRPVKYALYEFLVDEPPAMTPTTSEDGNSGKAIVSKYLEKTEPDFVSERAAMTGCSHQLRIIRDDAVLYEKYARQLSAFTLEELYRHDQRLRDEIACDAVFEAKSSDVSAVAALTDKRIVWAYLLAGKRFAAIVQWLNALHDVQHAIAPSTSGDYDAVLCATFARWTVDEEMLDELHTAGDIGSAVRDSLARCGSFLSDERENIAKQLRRIGRTETWPEHAERLASAEFRSGIVRLILDNNFTGLLIRGIADIGAL